MKRLVTSGLAALVLLAGCSGGGATAPGTAPAGTGAQPGSTASAAPGTQSSVAPTSDAPGVGQSSPGTAPSAGQKTNAKGEVLWPKNSTVSHLFFHSLVVDPKRAFLDKDGEGDQKYMVTKYEFEKILEQLYANAYVLVHPQRLAAKDDAGTMKWTPLYLPAGKKPLIISVDDVSYNKPTKGRGYADRLVIGSDGKVTNEYTDASGKTTTGAYDVPTVLDAFVEKHPDFSYGGDKGTIALTGYEGVFGYNSSPYVYGKNAKTEAAIEKAKEIADGLKKAGWNFASHSYGHRNFTTVDLKTMQGDMGRWANDVAPIVGKTDTLIYAFGADIAKGNEHYLPSNPKYAFLQQEGYDYFFNVDASTPAWYQLEPTSLRGNRINIDGIALTRAIDGRMPLVEQFFDPKAVVDPDRPMPTPGA